MTSFYWPIGKISGELYIGKGAGKRLLRYVDNAQKSVKVFSPSAAPKRQRGACTAQPQREKTLYHNVGECQAESKNGSGTGQPEREKILSQGDRIVKPHKNVHKLHAAACPIRIFSRKICAHIKGVNYHGNNQTHL